MSSSDAADSAVTFAPAMPAVGGASESSARQEETNTSQSLDSNGTLSSDSSGGRGRDRRVRALAGTPSRVEEEEPQSGSRSRSPSRPSTPATEIHLASTRTSPRGPSPRAMIGTGGQPGASRLLPSPIVGPSPRAMTPTVGQPGASRLLPSPVIGVQRGNPPSPNGIDDSLDIYNLPNLPLPGPLRMRTIGAFGASPRTGMSPAPSGFGIQSLTRSHSARRMRGGASGSDQPESFLPSGGRSPSTIPASSAPLLTPPAAVAGVRAISMNSGSDRGSLPYDIDMVERITQVRRAFPGHVSDG